MSARRPAIDCSTKKRAQAHWTARFTHGVSRETLAAHPWLKPVAHRLLEPGLWHVQHEAVARGVAIGLFWAFALPVGQILAAAVHCTWGRGNIPVAAGATLVTNPFTIRRGRRLYRRQSDLALARLVQAAHPAARPIKPAPQFFPPI